MNDLARATRVAAGTLLAVLALPALAQLDVTATCAEAAQVPTPPQDPPSAVQLASLAKCDAADLYYGITGRVDDTAARRCAYSHVGRAGFSPYLDGSTLLMMIYHNGRGVTRNLNLARKFACQLTSDDATREALLQHMHNAEIKKMALRPFDVCELRSSRPQILACTSHEHRVNRSRRERAYVELTRGWNPAQRAAFTKLRSAATAYFELHASAELDVRSDGRNLPAEQELEDGEEQLRVSLQAFANARLPSFSPADFRSADAALNKAYAALLKADLTATSIEPAGIRKTQRRWLEYREALVAFGAANYPQVPADAWRTYLTQLRVDVLNDLLTAYG